MLQYLHISKIICNFAGENTLPPYDVKLGEKEYMKQFITSLLAVALSITMAHADILQQVQIGEWYYNLDTENLTAEVSSPVNKTLTEITIPASVDYESTTYGVTTIGEHAFYRCDSLRTISIPNSITRIDECAFYMCWNLQSITIPASVENIGKYAFHGCLSLLSINVASDNTTYCSIDGILFSKDRTTLICYPNGKEGAYTIPDHVTVINSAAFMLCFQLTSITIPNSITHISEHAFYQCIALTSVTLPNHLTHIEQWAFSDCIELQSIVIPESVISIEKHAFGHCEKLTSVYIPAGVTFLGTEEGDANGTAFCACLSMTSINVSSENPNFSSIDGVLFSKDRKTLYQFPCGRKGTYVIPYGTNTISSYALYESDSLKSITIPSTVTRVEPASMGYCNTLDSVTCYAVTPPATGSIEHVGTNIFSGSPNVKLYVPEQSVDAYTSAYSWGGATAILPISANDVEVTEITLTPGTNSVDVVWPAITGADSYELVIRDENGNIICTLIFDADGRLRTIAFGAPSRNGVHQTAQQNGFYFTVTGLSSGTTYSYTMTAKDSDDNILDTRSGSFTTQAVTGVEEVESQIHRAKILRDGQIFILRGDKTYTITGAEVK